MTTHNRKIVIFGKWPFMVYLLIFLKCFGDTLRIKGAGAYYVLRSNVQVTCMTYIFDHD